MAAIDLPLVDPLLREQLELARGADDESVPSILVTHDADTRLPTVWLLNRRIGCGFRLSDDRICPQFSAYIPFAPQDVDEERFVVSSLFELDGVPAFLCKRSRSLVHVDRGIGWRPLYHQQAVIALMGQPLKKVPVARDDVLAEIEDNCKATATDATEMLEDVGKCTSFETFDLEENVADANRLVETFCDFACYVPDECASE